jgi:hypothetical protein
VPHSDDDLWSFVMLPDGQPVSMAFSFPFGSLCCISACSNGLFPQLVTVSTARTR